MYSKAGVGALWPSGLERWFALATGRCRPNSNPTAENIASELLAFVYPALPVSFGGDTKIRRSLLSGVYDRGSKTFHQSALECVTDVDSTTHSKPAPRSPIVVLGYCPINYNTRQYKRRNLLLS